MKRIRKIPIITIILTCSFSGCVEDGDKATHSYKPRETDGITMATPEGGELKPAEEGPVRSALGVPSIDLETFQLTINGLVDSSYSLNWEEIQELKPAYTGFMIMYCVEGWEVWGKWEGVLIKDLLDKAHVQTGGEYILFECVEGYKTALPIAYLVKYNSMLAYQVNGAPLQSQDGFPLRLIAFGKFGYKWAKWVHKLTVMDESQRGYWEKLGYDDRADVPLDRRRFYEGDSVKPLSY
jgi:DMSO/TMAO reductase YedYZ molybdopterin-dependent catalytic subunit